MSYLGSLLGTSAPSEQKVSNPTPAPKQRAQLQSTNPGTISSASRPNLTSGVKRKADDNLTGDAPKLQRAQTVTNSKLSPPSGHVFASSQRSSYSNTQARTSSVNGVKAAASKPKAAQAPAPAGVPSKGSFADIMARAKALQNTKLGQGPKLIHKATVNPRDDPKERKKEVEAKLRGKTNIKGNASSRSGSENPTKSGVSVSGKSKTKTVAEKPKRKPIEISYKGTMRQNPAVQSAYPSSAGSKMSASRGAQHGMYERRYSDDEIDDNDEEDDYGSDASSDMEAGAWDLDEEEEFSARTAKAEDAAAKREEEEHKRQKLLRKQGLASGPARRRF